MENVKLAREVLAQAEAEPGRFDMGDWITEDECGMTACIGGWTMIKSGYMFRWLPRTESRVWVRPDGTVVGGGYADEAAMLLGMDEAERRFGDGYEEIWFDMDHGLDRFRDLIEHCERETGA